MRMIGPTLFLSAAAALLGACDAEPDFDSRYRQEEARIKASASGMERDLREQMVLGNSAGEAAGAQ